MACVTGRGAGVTGVAGVAGRAAGETVNVGAAGADCVGAVGVGAGPVGAGCVDVVVVGVGVVVACVGAATRAAHRHTNRDNWRMAACRDQTGAPAQDAAGKFWMLLMTSSKVQEGSSVEPV